MSHLRSSQAGFTRGQLIMWLVVVFGPLLIALIFARDSPSLMTAKSRSNDAINQRTIVMALHDYAVDHEGKYPSSYTTSTEVFQHLIDHTDGLKDYHFYSAGKYLANHDRTLSPEENGYIYVSGQLDSAPLDSPLTADRMSEPGRYGKSHPFLKDGLAVVGYVGGHAKSEKLNQRRPGATVMGPPGSGMDDIFQPRPAGLLSVPRGNILLP